MRTSKILNGRAYTDGDTALLTDLPKDKQTVVINWIKNNIKRRESPNLKHTSYGIKHILQAQTNIYLTNNQFKDAMLHCDFFPVDERKTHWSFFISNKSPAFVMWGA